MKFRHHMQLVLQLTARVKDSQKAFEGLAMHQKQDLGLGIVSNFLIRSLNNTKC